MALVLALCAGTMAMLFQCQERPVRRGATPPRAEEAAPRGQKGIDHPPLSDERVVISVPSTQERPAAVDALEAEEAREPEGLGAIIGSIYDSQGNLLGRHAVSFNTGEDLRTGDTRMVWSDEGGFYEVENVPAGRRFAYYVGKTAGSSNGRVPFGELEVHSNQATVFDFVLTSDRVLSGALTVPEDEGLLLQLELRSFWERDRIVARGTAWSRAVESEQPPDENPELRPGEEEQASGYFRMEGLESGMYVLRIIVGTDNQGRSVFLEREIDLTTADVILEESFTHQDFADASVRRWMAED